MAIRTILRLPAVKAATGFDSTSLHPIGVSPDGQLVFGERRLLACRDLLGWTEIPARVVNLRSIVEGECHENGVRKDFTPSESNGRSMPSSSDGRERGQT
jgi:hypothetical protein